MSDPVVSVQGLTIDYRIDRKWMSAVRDVDLDVAPVQIHGIVGESGSGKSTLGLSIMRYMARNARIAAGRILFDGTDIVPLEQRDVSKLWGNQMSLVPQNPMDSLNPSLRVDRQMSELTELHLGLDSAAARERAMDALANVRIADPAEVIERYPHQLSGGMLQRVMIAMALSTRPRFIVFDEPTTALDVTTQAVILDLMRTLVKEEQSAALYVSHDLGTIAQLCDHVTVLYAGEVMESAPVRELFRESLHPYTAGLLACLPSESESLDSRLAVIQGVAPSLAERSDACVFADRCPIATEKCRTSKPPLETLPSGRKVRCWRRDEIAQGLDPVHREKGIHESVAPKEAQVLQASQVSKTFTEGRLLDSILGRQKVGVQAMRDVSIAVKERSTFGLVGESGSGKTTLARALVALTAADEGSIRLLDDPIDLSLRSRDREVLRNLRIVFQNPNDSLNPFRTVGQTIARTIRKLSPDRLSGAELREHVIEHLESVGLTAEYYSRRPGMLSGGEKQRVAIARSFAPHPALIVADEPTSSLDVSVQAVILNLLKDLRATEGASYILISHDLEVVAYLSDYIAVMYLGEIVEQGDSNAVLSFPSHPYTESLLSAAPVPDPERRVTPIKLEGEIPSPRNRPGGCPFHTRCPRKIGSICETELPPVRVAADGGHQIRCHHEMGTLESMQKEGPP